MRGTVASAGQGGILSSKRAVALHQHNMSYARPIRCYLWGMTNSLQPVTVKIPLSDLRRMPEPNRSEFIRAAVSEKLGREAGARWALKTARGRKLLALREKYIRAGGELLDSEGIAEELRHRRGGLA
jgi:hypothetical protein